MFGRNQFNQQEGAAPGSSGLAGESLHQAKLLALCQAVTPPVLVLVPLPPWWLNSHSQGILSGERVARSGGSTEWAASAVYAADHISLSQGASSCPLSLDKPEQTWTSIWAEKPVYHQQEEHIGKSHLRHVFLGNSPYRGSHISKCKKKIPP